VHLELSFLGGFVARLDGQAVGGFRSNKVRAPHIRTGLNCIAWSR
jgi:hypothetical protein